MRGHLRRTAMVRGRAGVEPHDPPIASVRSACPLRPQRRSPASASALLPPSPLYASTRLAADADAAVLHRRREAARLERAIDVVEAEHVVGLVLVLVAAGREVSLCTRDRAVTAQERSCAAQDWHVVDDRCSAALHMLLRWSASHKNDGASRGPSPHLAALTCSPQHRLSGTLT